MKTRLLSTRLSRLLSEDQGRQIGAIAASIGIAGNTLRALLRDDWDQLSRETIERVCDRFDLDVSDLFEFNQSSFWTTFASRGEYLILAGPRDRTLIDQYEARDAQARATITGYLANAFPGIKGKIKHDVVDERVAQDLVKNHNCIVVGSPRSNAATEYILAHHFGATAFDASVSNRRKVPFRFVFPKTIAIDSSLTEMESGVRGSEVGVGICNRDGSRLIAHADWWSAPDFRRVSINKGRDCALVVLLNRPFDTPHPVTTLVIAGLSAIGTLGGAHAVVRDFRDLTRLDGTDGDVVGVLEVTYRKPIVDSIERLMTGHKWKYLEGGRKRIR